VPPWLAAVGTGLLAGLAGVLLVVFGLLGLLDLAFTGWMWAVLPALGAASFVGVTLLVHALAGGAGEDRT